MKEVKFLEEETLGKGLSEVLKILRERGALSTEDLIRSGRSNDQIYEEVGVFNGENERIKLEYRDSEGRLMTPKEAFRYICHTFHGKQPGKNKLEKRKRR